MIFFMVVVCRPPAFPSLTDVTFRPNGRCHFCHREQRAHHSAQERPGGALVLLAKNVLLGYERGTERPRYHRPRHIVRALLLYLYTDELAFGDTVKLLLDVLCKAKELELTRVYNHCEQ